MPGPELAQPIVKNNNQTMKLTYDILVDGGINIKPVGGKITVKALDGNINVKKHKVR